MDTNIAELFKRMEPNIPGVENSPALASPELISIAISLKRIADALNEPNAYGEIGSSAIAGAIVRGLQGR